MKKIFLLSLPCVATIVSFAQTRKNVFLEVIGNAPHASINYDARFLPDRNDGFGFRAGVSTSVSWYNVKALTLGVPVGVNYLLGKQHALEVGLVAVPEFTVKQPESEQFTTDPSIAKTLFHGNLNIGYRYQPLKERGVMINALWTPTIISSKGYKDLKSRPLAMFGIGIGYSFKYFHDLR